ncbi:MAG TPA: hypothetical protein VFS15_05620 [Kofleriaceae bacterium]|nr:MAG: hypothetical protein DIU78_22265 [Pseudomonadota bacterium]HEU4611531.1 hypothetical protein [Kofleriaceae bacterium]
MSLTALDMLTDAMRLCNLLDENEVPSAEQGVKGLRTMNQMVAQWVEDGIRLPWHIVADLDDTLPIDVKDERGLKYNLAVELAGEYGMEVLPRVQEIAAETKAGLEKRYMQIIELSVDHLPTDCPISGSMTYPLE